MCTSAESVGKMKYLGSVGRKIVTQSSRLFNGEFLYYFMARPLMSGTEDEKPA